MGVLNIGFFGGSFDPPHKGHEEIASLAIDLLELDILYICPAGGVVENKKPAASSYKKRLQMTNQAFSSLPRAKVVNWEQGKVPSYTYDTVASLIERKKTPTNYFVIMGADSFLNIRSWKKYEQLCSLVKIAVFPRKGISGQLVKGFTNDLKQTSSCFDKLIFVEKDVSNISSSEIRKKIQ